MSIRWRLVVVVVSLVAVALGAIGGAVYVRVDHFLISQIDASLDRITASASRRLDSEILDGSGTSADSPGSGATVPTTPQFSNADAYFVELRGAAGNVLSTHPRTVGDTSESPPRLPADIATATAERYTLASIDGSVRYRVRVARVPGEGIMIVAASLNEANATMQHLLVVEVVGSVVVLLVLALLARVMVAAGLRPLRHIQQATATIVGDDLSHRIEVPHPGTEVGTLATSYNSMLDRLETSFTAQHAAEERLRQFIADASHELRTPLTSIRGYAELHGAGALTDPADVTRAMRRIEGEATRMGALVEDLLLLARLDEREQTVSVRVGLCSLAMDAVSDARAVEPKRSIRLDVPDAEVFVSGDPGRLGQVVANLLGNVRAHAGDGADVTVSVRDLGAMVSLTVADSGVGMDSPTLGHAVDRLSRGDASRGADGHFGLGLSIAASIVQAHRGTLVVESTLGAGTTVTVTLPRP